MFRLPEYTWDKDRELCLKCANCVTRVSAAEKGGGVTMMSCKLVMFRFSSIGSSCIGMRTEGDCGMDGKLFKPKEQDAVPQP